MAGEDSPPFPCPLVDTCLVGGSAGRLPSAFFFLPWAWAELPPLLQQPGWRRSDPAAVRLSRAALPCLPCIETACQGGGSCPRQAQGGLY